MISQTAEYALRSVVCLASQPQTALTTVQIAKITKVPGSYLSKVLQALGKAKIVRSQRGLHGGFSLARPAEELSLLDVINAVDPIQHIDRCPLNLDQHGSNLCPLHNRLNDSIRMIEKAYRDSTIGDLLKESTGSKPLCETPETPRS
jgi:Rrf2 family transcriptional regulator, nitric oxide-sensitive transcriptional repressor